MTKDLIKKNYQKKIKLFNYYNKKYYDENISEITDSNFDQLKKEIIKLEEKHLFLKSKNSPTSSVGWGTLGPGRCRVDSTMVMPLRIYDQAPSLKSYAVTQCDSKNDSAA